MKNFDQAIYWKERVSGRMGLGAVGHRSLGPDYNQWIYQRRVDVLGSVCDDLLNIGDGSRVLDLGCGSGFYEAFWQSREIRHLTGVDISAQNISAIQLLYPEYRFIEADLSKRNTVLGEQYDVVTLFDVLYHLVDDEDAVRALGYVAAHLSQNGHFLIFDQLLKQDYSLRKHVKFRGRKNFAHMLHSLGMEIEREIPLFVLLEPPISGYRPLDLFITGIYYTAGLVFRAIPPIGAAVGRAAYAIDAALVKRRILTQNHSLYVVRHTR